MALAVHLISLESAPDIPLIKAGFTDSKNPQVVATVLVEDDGLPVMVVVVCSRNEDIHFFRERALIWDNNLVVGVGHQVTLVRLDNHTSTTLDLGTYFGYLYPHSAVMLVASATHLYCLEANGTVRWKSDDFLGVDGVQVDRIENGIVYGAGQLDPPYEWVPFTLDLATGRRLDLQT